MNHEPFAAATDSKLAAIFKPIAQQLTANEEKIVSELLSVQGQPVDIDGYYQPDPTPHYAPARH